MAGSIEGLMPAHPDVRLAFFDPDLKEGDGTVPFLRIEPAAAMALVREGSRTSAVLLAHDDRGELLPAAGCVGFLGSFYKQDDRDRFADMIGQILKKNLPQRPAAGKVKR